MARGEAPNPEAALELQRLKNRQWAQREIDQETAADIEIPLHSVAEIRARKRPEWLVEDIIPESSIVLMAGPPGIGKSFTALGISLSVASGSSWLGRPVKPARVLYIAGEGVSGFPGRVEAHEAFHGVTVPDDGFMLAETGVNLSSEASVERLAEIIKRERFGLVVLDTFRKLSAVKDENDSALVTEVFRNALRLRQAAPDCSVLIVHHANKTGDVNGSFAFQSEPDVVWVLEGNSEGFSMSSRTEDHGKMKDAPGDRIKGLRLRPALDSAVVTSSPRLVVDPLTGLITSQTYKTAKLRETIMLNGECSRNTALRTIENLMATGRLLKVAHGTYLVAAESEAQAA
ncbi:AAA family ATPase [Humibacter ginsengiterrae]